MSKLLYIPLILFTLSAATCQTLYSEQEANKFTAAQIASVCDIVSPIYYDGELDTPATKTQVRRHNAAIKAFCKQ